MRLLNVGSRQLHTFYDTSIPPYAILSHTWDQENPEVSFDDMKRPDHVKMTRYDKIEQTCWLAKAQGLDWVWIDTCCIDKSSSAELSEAINSMFRWYGESTICFVHLEDLEKKDLEKKDWEAFPGFTFKFECCRWFGRGWTLQELLAPSKLEFYDRAWKIIGDRSTLAKHIQHRTGIPTDYLRDPRINVHQARVGERMSWAADRNTTRKEDIAYCLFGLFDVNMPLLYGEGDRAFHRLQEEIIRTSADDSIFAWSSRDRIIDLRQPDTLERLDAREGSHSPPTPLALSPRLFECLKHKALPPGPLMKRQKTWEMTKGGLQVNLPLYRLRQGSKSLRLMLLDCALEGSIDRIPFITLHELQPNIYQRRGLFMASWDYLATRTRHDVVTIHISSSHKSPGENVAIEILNWLEVDHLFIKVNGPTKDHIIDTRYLAPPARYWIPELILTAEPPTSWLRMAVHFRAESAEHLLIIEKVTFRWALWISQDWLCQPVNYYVIKMFSGSSIDAAIRLPKSLLRKTANEEHNITRAIRTRDSCLMGSYYHVIEIYESKPASPPKGEERDEPALPSDNMAPEVQPIGEVISIFMMWALFVAFLVYTFTPVAQIVLGTEKQDRKRTPSHLLLFCKLILLVATSHGFAVMIVETEGRLLISGHPVLVLLAGLGWLCRHRGWLGKAWRFPFLTFVCTYAALSFYGVLAPALDIFEHGVFYTLLIKAFGATVSNTMALNWNAECNDITKAELTANWDGQLNIKSSA